MVRAQLDPPRFQYLVVEDPGGLAQLGEHLLCKQGVVGSIPSSSTKIAWWQQAKSLQDEKSAKKRAIIFDSTLKQSRVRLL